MIVGTYTDQLVTAVDGHVLEHSIADGHLQFSLLLGDDLAFQALKCFRHYAPDRSNGFQQLSLGVYCRAACCIAGKEGNTAAVGTRIPGSQECIRHESLNHIHGQAKFFCYDCCHDGIGTLTDIMRTDIKCAHTPLVQTDLYTCGGLVWCFQYGEAGT